MRKLALTALLLLAAFGCTHADRDSSYTSQVESELYASNDALAVFCTTAVDNMGAATVSGPVSTACDWQRLGLAECEEDEWCALVNGPHHA